MNATQYQGLSDQGLTDDKSPVPRSPWALLRPYRSRVILACIMLLATSALALTIPKLLGRTIEALTGANAHKLVPTLAMWMIAIAIAQAGTRIASRVLLFNAARMAEYDLRALLFRHLLTLDSKYYREHPTGDIMSRLTNDVQTVRAVWGPGLLNLVNTSFLFTVALTLMLRVDPILTLWALLPYPSMVLLGLAFGKQIYKASRGVQDQLGKLSSLIQEDLSGVAIIKSYNLEKSRLEKFAGASEVLMDQNMILTRVRGRLVPTLGAVAALGTVVVLFLGGQHVIDGRINLGQLIEFNAYLAALVWPTLALGWMISLLQRGKASWERLQAILDSEAEIHDGPAAPIEPASVRGEIELRNLSVALANKTIIKNLSLKLQSGTTTAIVGRTGSGKSSLISALPRLNGVPDKSIFIDGQDINQMSLHSLRSMIGFAPQEAFLFSTSIGNNIRYGVERRPVPPVDEAGYASAIMDAARAAGLSRDLEALPQGLDTVVGERGITLSGGQRQRVALARALATEPKILVLDDSLSSVDAETEREILSSLAELMKDRTSILISHRLAAVRRADQIAVIDEGQLVELGDHDQLLAKQGVYAQIYDTQLKEGLLGE